MVKLPGGGTAEQTVRLVDAHQPERLTFVSNIGRHRVVSVYRIRDQFGHARIRATVEWVLPYARALLGARWAGDDRGQEPFC